MSNEHLSLNARQGPSTSTLRFLDNFSRPSWGQLASQPLVVGSLASAVPSTLMSTNNEHTNKCEREKGKERSEKKPLGSVWPRVEDLSISG